MIFFITVMRALAACFITNAHYTGIYPTDIIANGGLLGDILFFAVSGYCLYNIKKPFWKWYGKRIYRVYLPVIIITIFYILIGAYNLQEHSAIWYLLYPTTYHFVASIMILYIPFYFCMKLKILKTHILIVMGIVMVVGGHLYLTIYDRSYYHIDTVREPMIRFLFMESMLLGAWFRQNDKAIRNQFKWKYLIAALGSFLLYFGSKLLFSHRESLAPFQILNWSTIFISLVLIFITCAGADSKLEAMPRGVKRVIEFISSITLEIYLVQNVLINAIRPLGHFPINWFLLTALIIATAFILHEVCKLIYAVIEQILLRTK